MLRMIRASIVLCCFVAPSALAATTPARVTGVELRPRGERIDVVVRATEPLTFQSWARSQPPVLVVDLMDTAADERVITPEIPSAIQKIQLSRHDARGAALSRVSVHLKSVVDYDVTARGNEITVSLFPQGGVHNFTTKTPPVIALSTRRGVGADVPAQGVVEGSIGRATSDTGDFDIAQAGEKRAMTYIGFRNTAQNSRVYARMNGDAKYTVRKEGDSLVVIEIQNATVPLRNNKNHLDTTFFDSPVKMITPSEIEDATPTIRIAIEMKQAAPFEHRREGNEIVVIFKK